MNENIWVIRMDKMENTIFNGKDIYTEFGKCSMSDHNIFSDLEYISLKKNINNHTLSTEELTSKILILKKKYNIKKEGNCIDILTSWSKNMKIGDYIFIYHYEKGIKRTSLAQISSGIDFFTIEKIFTGIDIPDEKIELMKRKIDKLQSIPKELEDKIRKSYILKTLVKVNKSTTIGKVCVEYINNTRR